MRSVRRLISLLLISVSLWTSTARASCPIEQCEKAVTDCRAALDAREVEVSICRLGLSQTLDDNQQMRAELANKNQQLSSAIRNPFIMTTVGVVIGLVVAGFAFK